jgi:hypothetical protein
VRFLLHESARSVLQRLQVLAIHFQEVQIEFHTAGLVFHISHGLFDTLLVAATDVYTSMVEGELFDRFETDSGVA